jgi:hypothetical protein
MKVELSTGLYFHSFVAVNISIVILGEQGVIEGAFGTSGKFRVAIPGWLLRQ